MTINNIRVGMTLRLKADRAKTYGDINPFVKVTGIRPRGYGYKSFWIESTQDNGTTYAYRPQDFQGETQ